MKYLAQLVMRRILAPTNDTDYLNTKTSSKLEVKDGMGDDSHIRWG